MPSANNRPGDFTIHEIRLIGRNNEFADLDNYIVELNIHEDIFGNAVHGTLIISDQQNLLRFFPIEGQEILLIYITSDRFEDTAPLRIKKQFRVYSISDRFMGRERNTQVYTLHFVSFEAFKSALTPLYRPFEGDLTTDVAAEIFETSIAMPRYPDEGPTELEILDPSVNPVKFISPGWQPFKCMNWLAQKSISSEGVGCNYLFWETTKKYYFGSVEKIMKNLASGETYGFYHYRERNIQIEEISTSAQAKWNREFFSVESMDIINTADHLKLTTEGEFASTTLTIDINKKDFTNTPYLHTEGFPEVTHVPVEGDVQAVWGSSVELNPKNSLYFTSKNTHLWNEFPNNVNEVYKDIFGRRIANLRDISNFKLQITIAGRSDIQTGGSIFLFWPNATDKTSVNYTDMGYDPRYSGYYVITAIRHKITLEDYTCFLEVVKDAFTPKLADENLPVMPDQTDAETARLIRQNTQLAGG